MGNRSSIKHPAPPADQRDRHARTNADAFWPSSSQISGLVSWQQVRTLFVLPTHQQVCRWNRWKNWNEPKNQHVLDHCGVDAVRLQKNRSRPSQESALLVAKSKKPLFSAGLWPPAPRPLRIGASNRQGGTQTEQTNQKGHWSAGDQKNYHNSIGFSTLHGYCIVLCSIFFKGYHMISWYQWILLVLNSLIPHRQILLPQSPVARSEAAQHDWSSSATAFDRSAASGAVQRNKERSHVKQKQAITDLP